MAFQAQQARRSEMNDLTRKLLRLVDKDRIKQTLLELVRISSPTGEARSPRVEKRQPKPLEFVNDAKKASLERLHNRACDFGGDLIRCLDAEKTAR